MLQFLSQLHGRRKGENKGDKAPHGFWNLTFSHRFFCKKGCFLSFGVGKMKFSHFLPPPLVKVVLVTPGKSAIGPFLEKILSTPMLSYCNDSYNCPNHPHVSKNADLLVVCCLQIEKSSTISSKNFSRLDGLVLWYSSQLIMAVDVRYTALC